MNKIKQFPPSDREYTYFQLNRGDDTGSIWSSMGLDFQSNLGMLRVSPRLRISTSTSDDAQLGTPWAFMASEGWTWAVCGAVIFYVQDDGINTTWTQDAFTNTPTNCDDSSDLESFNNRLWVTSSDALLSKTTNGGAWTQRDNFTSEECHALTYFGNVPGGRLYYAATDNEVWSIDKSDIIADDPGSEDYCIELPETTISCMDATTDSIWIGTDQVDAQDAEEDALIFQWDGISNQATNTFSVKGAQKIMAIRIMNDVPYCMDDNGILSRFTGYSFEEVGRLPYTTIKPVRDYMCKNGMIVTQNNTIQIVIDNNNINSTTSIYENLPSGVWEWSEQFGFVHKYSFTYNTNASPATITDYGQNRISVAGALYNASHIDQGVPNANGQLLAGATYFTAATGTSSAIFFDDTTNTIQKKGYFVTTWFDSDEIQDNWVRAWAVYRRFLDSGDSIDIKYRLYEEDPIYATITWVNTTSFTTTTDITAYGPTADGFDGTTGGEVEIINGTGGGTCVHITNIVNNGGTYTVTLKNAVTGVTTGTAYARFQKWILLNPTQPQDQVLSYSQYAIDKSNNRIQFKGCMTFKGDDEFFKLPIVSNSDIKINS